MADAEVAPPAATQPQSDGSGPLETAVANETRGDGAPNATPAAGEADEQGPEAEGPGATAEAEVPGATAEAEAEDVGEAPQVVFDFEALPQDVETMVMTGATQAIFSCKMDEDVTASNPYKLIPLEAIKEDIRNRAGVSDMAPFKEKMNKYEGTEVLIVYDRNFTFDACFWCCTTEGAKVAFLQHMREKEEAAQQAAKEEEAAAVEAVAAKRSAGWTNLGSDLEIDAARVVPERPLMQLMMSRKRRLFGAPLTLSDSTYPEDRVEFLPNVEFASVAPSVPEGEEEPPAALHVAEKDVAVQAVPTTDEVSAQTEWRQPQNACTQWTPQQDGAVAANPEEEACRLEAVKALLATHLPHITATLEQNNLLDVFSDDFSQLPTPQSLALGGGDDSTFKEFQSCKYMGFDKDYGVTSIDWHPTIQGVLAVAYSNNQTFEERVTASSAVAKSVVLVWSLTDPIQPQMVLEAPDDIFAVRWCPGHPQVVAGGCINSQLVLWDMGESRHRRLEALGGDASASHAGHKAGQDDARVPSLPYSAVSSIDDGHRAGVTDLHWLPEATELDETTRLVASSCPHSCQLASTAADGLVHFWDIRQGEGAEKRVGSLRGLDLVWKPFATSFLTGAVSSEYPATKLSVAATQGDARPASGEEPPEGANPLASKVFVGTQQGDIAYLDWQPPILDGGKVGVQKIEETYQAHGGSVAGLQRSPFSPDLLLSGGGVSVSVWKEGLHKTPLISYRTSGAGVVDVAWSLTRPAVFFVGRDDGAIDVWDLVDSSYAPVLTTAVTSHVQLTDLRPCCVGGHNFLAAGDTRGVLHVLDLPASVTHPAADEAAAVRELVKQEAERLTAKAALDTAVTPPATTDTVPEVDEKGLLAQFAKDEQEFLLQLGLLEPEPAEE